MSFKHFQGVNVAPPNDPTIKRRYSLTQDVVGFRRCPRQYGEFHVHKYAPAQQTQLYFGTILHQVLDRAHAHYHGVMDASTKGQLPTDTDIQRYFDDVEKGLKSRGIYAVTPAIRDKAIRILQYFNNLEGPDLYPRVVDTEHRLQADRGDHIIRGVIDLLINPQSGSDDPAEREMWDYKGTQRRGLTVADLETYQFQMRVYARLYELKHGVLPRKAYLYFLNELDGDRPPSHRPVNAVLDVSLERAEIDQAVDAFTQTVQHIETARAGDTWPPAQPGCISDQDCAVCDFQWDCPTPNNGRGVLLRFP